VGVAGIVVYRYPALEEASRVAVEHPVRFPYIPGLLSFRELPLILAGMASLPTLPDVLLVDGQGIAHPRRLGIASHLGVLLERPTIGCAKRVLVGTAREPGQARGAVSELRDGSEIIGALVRTRPGVQPVYVSVGHRIDLESAVRVVLETTAGYRIPEPTRQAHLHVNLMRRNAGKESL